MLRACVRVPNKRLKEQILELRVYFVNIYKVLEEFLLHQYHLQMDKVVDIQLDYYPIVYYQIYHQEYIDPEFVHPIVDQPYNRYHHYQDYIQFHN